MKKTIKIALLLINIFTIITLFSYKENFLAYSNLLITLIIILKK